MMPAPGVEYGAIHGLFQHRLWTMNPARFLYSQQGRLKRFLLGQRVVFHHVPKCAGTSVSRALRVRYALSQTSIAAPGTAAVIDEQYGKAGFTDLTHYNRVRRFRIELMHYMMWKDVYFIGGHVPFNTVAYNHLGKGYRFITVLRDPVERFISEYRFNRGRQHQARIDEELTDYVASPMGRRNAMKLCDYLSGADNLTLDDPESLKKDAIANLNRFDVIGFTDAMETFEEMARGTLGIRVKFGLENQGKPTSPSDSIPSSLLSQIRYLCRHDQEIYESAREKVFGSR